MMENSNFSEETLVSRRLMEKLEGMLRKTLKDDDKCLKIALEILRLYAEGGSSRVRSYLNKLMEEEIGDKAR